MQNGAWLPTDTIIEIALYAQHTGHGTHVCAAALQDFHVCCFVEFAFVG